MKTEVSQTTSAPSSNEASETENIELSFTDLELDAITTGVARRC